MEISGRDLYFNLDHYFNLTKEEYNEFAEDNNLKTDFYLIKYHFAYFNILTQLYDLSYRMPIYHYNERRELTLYHPPAPPRLFTTFFEDLFGLWERLSAELHKCFTFKPGFNMKGYQTPWFFGYVQHPLAPYGGYLNKSGVIIGGEIWIEDYNFLLPISLKIKIKALYRICKKDLDSTYKSSFPIYNNWLHHHTDIKLNLPVIDVEEYRFEGKEFKTYESRAFKRI